MSKNTTNTIPSDLKPFVVPILLVEDNPDFREQLAATIKSADDMYLIAAAADFDEAVLYLDQHAPEVLLVDLGLPGGKNGIDLIRHARQRYGDNCQSMVISVFGDEQSIIGAIENGATGYLLKDDSDANVLRKIRELRQGGSPLSPMVARKILTQHQAMSGNNGSANPLSKQEQTVLLMISKGLTHEEIAEQIGVTKSTVGSYVARAKAKFQAKTSQEAAYEARKCGYIAD